MEAAGKDLIETIYKAFNERRVELLMALMHPRVHWPNGWEGGWLEGREAVADYWQRQWKEMDPAVVPLSCTATGDGRIDVRVQQTVKDLKGTLLGEGLVSHVYTIKDGLILSMEIRKEES